MKTSKPAAWFRLYAEFAHDPKVQMLSETDQRRYIMLLCLRCGNGDVTLHETEVAFQLRISNEEWGATKARLMEKNLIDEDSKPIAWDKRQYASDSSAERVAKHREKLKQQCNVTVTPPETETETEKERGKPIPANAGHSRGASDSVPDFDQFWSRWPKKVGKQEAKREWLKLAPDLLTLDALMAGVERVVADPDRWSKDGRAWQVLPDPSRWLKGRRWEDVVPLRVAEYAADELDLMATYNAVLAEKGWPPASANPFSTERAAAIREFLGFGSKPGWVDAYIAWLADNLPAKEGLGFDWAIRRATYIRAKEGNFAALRESA